MRVLFGAALFSLVGVSAAAAATLSDVSGAVSIDTGRGFSVAKANLPLGPGTRIMAASGAKAMLRYTASCAIPIKPHRVYTVVEMPPCAPGRDLANVEGHKIGAAGAGSQLPPPPSTLFSPTNLLIGAGIAAGVAGAVVLATQEDDDDPPASP